ncbi:MAG: hypothetical protein ACRCZE_03615 [Candidatus Altimarinota bacterium]
MKKDLLKNWNFKNQSLGFLSKRLIWKEVSDSPVETGPESKEKEKSPTEKLDAKTEFLRHLKLNEGKTIELKKPNILVLRALVKAEVAKLAADDEMKKGLDQELMDGLLENFGAKGKEEILNKWMREKKVIGFKIEDGQWKFYTKDAKGKELEVGHQYALDSVGNGKDLYEANLSKEVKERREGEFKEKEAAKAADAKLLAEDPANINSAPRLVGELTQADYFQKMVESTGIKGKELAVQLKQKFLAQLDAAVAGGKIPPDLMRNSEGLPIYSADMDEAAKLKGAAELLPKMGVTEMMIKEGQLIYKKGESEVRELFTGVAGIYVSEKAEKAGVEKKAEQEKTEQQGKEIEKTKTIEKSGIEPALEKAILDKIKEPLNYRYVEAIKALYEYKGGEIKFDLPATGDKPLKCTFKENPAKKGDYILIYSKSGRFDLRGGKTKEETLLWMIKHINNGGFAQEVQGNNLRSAAKFKVEKFDNIDSGPEMVDSDDIADLREAGYGISPVTQKMELDWESRGTDPMVYMTAGQHGKIDVIVKKSDIGGEGKDFYRFTADGFQDMARRLGSLRQWREPTENDQDRAKFNAWEKVRRHFETDQFARDLNKVGGLEGMKFPAQTVLEVRYSWLTKQKPNEAFVIQAQELGQGFQYAVRMKSGNNVIFQAATVEELIKKLSEEKIAISSVGGEMIKNQEVEKWLKTAEGGPYSLSEGVKVYGMRGNTLELAWGDGKIPYQFDMPGEMAKAKEMGLVYANKEKAVKPYEGAKLEEQTFSGGLKVEGKTGPDLSEAMKKEVDLTAKKIVDPTKRQQFVDFMNNVSDKNSDDKWIKHVIIKSLSVMAGELIKISELPPVDNLKANDDAITKYIRIINSNKEKKDVPPTLMAKLDKPVQEALSKLPRSKKLVENLLMAVERGDLGNDAKAKKKLTEDYQKFLNAELISIISQTEQVEPKLKDQKMLEEISKLKDVGMYMKEWHASYLAFNKKEEQSKKAYESKDKVEVGKSHRGKLADLIKEDLGAADDLRYMAVQLLSGLPVPEKTSALKYEPEISNVVDNNLKNHSSLYLNIAVGGRDYTLGLIRKMDGKVTHTLADGKNNPAKFGSGGGRAIEFGAESKPVTIEEMDKTKGDMVLVMVSRLEAIKKNSGLLPNGAKNGLERAFSLDSSRFICSCLNYVWKILYLYINCLCEL